MLWSRFVILQLADTHLLKGGQGSQGSSCSPNRVLVFISVMILIFVVLSTRNMISSCTLSAVLWFIVVPIDTKTDTNRHHVGVQVLTDIYIMLQNRDECTVVNKTWRRRREEVVKKDYRKDVYKMVRAIRTWLCIQGL